MECRNARALVAGYTDGELSESQAAPLRAHLMDCPSCRSLVQVQNALSEWFVSEPAIEVPAGFAARVARRAFAGDTGEVQVAHVSSTASGSDEGGEGKLLQFVLQITAAAAAILIVFSIALRSIDAPTTDGLYADDSSMKRSVDRLEELNRAELENQTPEGRAERESDEDEPEEPEESQQ